jgi:hypothetical protein
LDTLFYGKSIDLAQTFDNILIGVLHGYRLNSQRQCFFPVKTIVLSKAFCSKKVMAIETHPDDIVFNCGVLMDKVVIPSARQVLFVTAIPDEAGVEDEFKLNVPKEITAFFDRSTIALA